MKKKYKLLLSTIGLLSISTITISSVISCSDGSDNSTKNKDSSNSNNNNNNNNKNDVKNSYNSTKSGSNSHSPKPTSSPNSNNNSPTNYSTTLSIEQISNALTSYFSDTNNQIALINYLLKNGYITYSNDSWNYNTKNYSGWTSALIKGISAFISHNQDISYDGILGSIINTNNLLITSTSYSASNGLVFTIGISASNNVTISSATFSQYIENSNSSNSAIVNALTTYFNNTNNQMALIKYLLNNGYITCSNGVWSYDKNNSYTSWYDVLSNGISEFIANNSNISYDGILGSKINLDYIWINNISYSTSSGLTFNITYNSISAGGNITISSATFSQYIENSNSSNSAIVNALTTYFSNTNNQLALINYLVNNYYITFSNSAWNYDLIPSNLNDYNSFTSWSSALSAGINAFISSNSSISYDIGLSSNIDTSNLSITSASYDATSGLVFSIVYNGISATNNVDISTSSLNIFINENTNVVNALTTYFSNTNNQMALIKYLLNNGYITYSDGTWDYNTNSSISEVNNGDGYTSWASALSNGISAFISANSNISYDGILGWNINIGDFSITNASYDATSGLVFSIAYNGITISNNVDISSNTLDDYLSNYYNKTTNLSDAITTVNAITSYFNKTNNQMDLLTYLWNNDYITYEDGTWNYDTTLSSLNNGPFTSWDDALTSAVSNFIHSNKNISYDGIWGSNINVGQQFNQETNSYNASDLSINSTLYSESGGLVFTITYSGISATSNVHISTSTLNSFIDKSTNVANGLTTYFSNTNNQISLINYLVNNDYITYNNGTWSYDKNSSILNNDSSFSNWNDALSAGINAFITRNQFILYGGVLGVHIINSDIFVNSSSYINASGLVFTIGIDGFFANSSITISAGTLDAYNNKNTNSSNTTIANALTNYFNNANNQMALINYLLLSNYITYENGTWSYDPTPSDSNNYNSFTSWSSALSAGISIFIRAGSNISYNGISGSNINTSDLSIISASYSAVDVLVFTIAYNGISASSSVTIANALNSFVDENINIVNVITAYFSNANNQMALINYLLNNSYITYNNGNLSYDENLWTLVTSFRFTSWTSALSAGINAFLSSNPNISYNGIAGVGRNVDFSSGINFDYNLSVTSASYSAAGGLIFTIACNGISTSSNVTISAGTLSNYNKESTNSSNIVIANAITNYFNDANNQMALINYLVNNNVITYSDDTWSYYGMPSSLNYDIQFTSWNNALSIGISAFIGGNQNISYDGILGSDIVVYSNAIGSDLSITSASYNAATGLVFTITYNGVSASSSVTISAGTLNDYNNLKTNSSNSAIANALTTYFGNESNQMALIKYLLNGNYITYSNGRLTYGNNYSSWASALSSGIRTFISANQNISYDGILGSSINVGYSFNDNTGSYNANDLSITSASYSTTTGLIFAFAYNDISVSNNVTISASTLNYYQNKNTHLSNITIVNLITTYFNKINNQIALINYLANNDYITYSDVTWSYDQTPSDLNDYNSFTSWSSALSAGISAFIAANSNISYDGILVSLNINIDNLSITSASYSTTKMLVFQIAYNDVSASSNVTISAGTLNDCNNLNADSLNTIIANNLTTYFSSINNQMAFINYLINNDYITYSNEAWTYANNYTSLINALSSGISAFIANNQNIYYDGILGSNINTSDISINSVSYSASGNLVFNMECDNTSANSSIKLMPLKEYLTTKFWYNN